MIARRSMLLGLAVFSLIPAMAACGGSERAEEDDGQGTAEGQIALGADGQAILDGLRARVGRDFSEVESLEGYKLVFYFGPQSTTGHRLKTDGKKALVMARIMKRDSQGHDFALADADYRGSTFQAAIDAGAFDGPEVVALLERESDRTWTIASTEKSKSFPQMAGYEAYTVGPTDVPWEPWQVDFNLPTDWF